jgi:hypothetical protein
MRDLLKTDATFVWTDNRQQAFEQLKQALITAPMLALPDFPRQFILTTDASTSSIAYILSQKDSDGRERAVNYAGLALHVNETKCGITELQCLALVEGVKHNHVHLMNQHFKVVTDHVSLAFLQKMKLAGNHRLKCWALSYSRTNSW